MYCDDAGPSSSIFYLGKPCARGHGGKRYRNNRRCVACRTAEDARRDATVHRKAHKQRGHRKRKYDITSNEFNFMLASQQYRCAICGTDTPGGRGTWHVDHCHSTQLVRGLLCHSCNIGLGHFGDSPASLLAAIAYLRSSPEL